MSSNFHPKPAIRLSGSWVTGCNTLRCIHSSPDLCCVFCICLFTNNEYQKYKSVDTITQNLIVNSQDLGSLDPICCAVSNSPDQDLTYKSVKPNVKRNVLRRPKDTHIFPQNSNRKDFSLWTHCIYIIYYINHTCD